MKRFSSSIAEAFNPNAGQGERFIEWTVRFSVVQVEVYDTLTCAAIENPDISRLPQTIDRNNDLLDILTFELGGFPLDGSKVIPPRPNELPDAQVGLVMNELSDEGGLFSTPQVYTATTTYAYDLIAVTLDWGFAPAVDFTVAWYNGSTLLHTETVTGNAQRISLMNHAVPGVNKVVVTITRGQPLHFARLAEFIPGAILDYDRHNSDSVTLEEVTDPLSERAAAGTLSLVTDNMAQQFNIFDPAGVYRYFKDRMPLYPTISGRSPDGGFERIQMGKYYLQAPLLKGNLAKLQLDANNLLGTLQDSMYTKGVYKTATLAQFAEDVAADAGITIRYPAKLSSIMLNTYVPSQSHAQIFADIARAANLLLRVGVDDALEFYEPEGEALMTIGMEDYRSDNGLSPSDDAIINTVELEVVKYSLGASTQLSQLPATGSIVSSAFHADNAVIVTTAGTYYPKYSPASGMTATLTGGNLTITGQPLVKTLSTVSVTTRQENERAFIYTGKSSTFVQAVNAQAVAEHTLLRKARQRRIVKINYRGYPYLEMGDTVEFNSGGENTPPFFLTKNRLTLGGGMTGTLEAREL